MFNGIQIIKIVQAIERVKMIVMPTIFLRSCSYTSNYIMLKDQPIWIQIKILYNDL